MADEDDDGDGNISDDAYLNDVVSLHGFVLEKHFCTLQLIDSGLLRGILQTESGNAALAHLDAIEADPALLEMLSRRGW